MQTNSEQVLSRVNARRYADVTFWSALIPIAILFGLFIIGGLVFISGMVFKGESAMAATYAIGGLIGLTIVFALLLAALWALSWLTAIIYNALTGVIGPMRFTLGQENDTLSLLKIDRAQYLRYQFVRVAISCVFTALVFLIVNAFADNPAEYFQLGSVFAGMPFVLAFTVYYLGLSVVGIIFGQLLVIMYNAIQKPLRATVATAEESTNFLNFAYWPFTGWFGFVVLIQILAQTALPYLHIITAPEGTSMMVLVNLVMILIAIPVCTIIGLSLYRFAVHRTGGIQVEFTPVAGARTLKASEPAVATKSRPVPAVKARKAPAKKKRTASPSRR